MMETSNSLLVLLDFSNVLPLMSYKE